MKNIKIHPIIYFSIIVLFLEILIKKVMTAHIWNISLLYMIFFSIPLIVLFSVLTKVFNKKVNRVLLYLITIILTIYFEVQLIFFNLFSTPFSFQTIGLANQALDFTNIIKDAVMSHLVYFLLFLLPIVLLIIFRKKIDTTTNRKNSLILTIILLIIASANLISLIPGKDKTDSLYKLYYNTDDAVREINNFGLLTYTKIDLKRLAFGYEQELTIAGEPEYELPAELIDEELGFNSLELDFNKETSNNNIQKLNEYFSNTMPTNKNEYTGMFKGKNLIFILAEGFNEIAVDPVRTPTLYNMIHTGFDFTSFYSPVFLSTTGGEFQATTGLIPTQETLTLWKSKMPKIAFGLGHSFSNIGYRAQSYHDWTYTYYARQKTMETIGFYNYMGCGNGLEDLLHTKEELKHMTYACDWLEFDSDMMKVSDPLYMGKEGNFVTYYVTVSGHSPYVLGGNITRRYYDAVKDTDYDNGVKAYLAAQMELDRAVEQLITDLKASGELDNTVIALVGDHYPYTLSAEQMSSAAGKTKDGVVEVNHSNFILWNSTMKEPVVVDKVGSQIDVLPTLLNLFGIDYDSRLIVGKDILSEYEGLAIFSNRSWVSDYGTYYRNSNRFVLKDGKELENINDYVARINQRVSNAFTISNLLVGNDYYSYILEK